VVSAYLLQFGRRKSIQPLHFNTVCSFATVIFLLEVISVTNHCCCVFVKNAIRQLFSSDSSETSVRSQVCNVVCLLVTTVHQIYAVFYAGDGDTDQRGTIYVCLHFC